MLIITLSLNVNSTTQLNEIIIKCYKLGAGLVVVEGRLQEHLVMPVVPQRRLQGLLVRTNDFEGIIYNVLYIRLVCDILYNNSI